MKNKDKFWIILSLVVVFSAGFIGGVFSERYYLQKRHARSDRGSAHFPSLEQMAKDLDLSAEQEEKIRNIFEENEAKFKELRTEIHGRLMGIRAELKSQIESVLSAEQKQKFQAMIEKYVAQRKKESEERIDKSNQKQRQDKDKGEAR